MRGIYIASVMCLSLIGSEAVAATSSFTALGEHARPNAVSGNGEVVVGRITSNSKAFTWEGGTLTQLLYSTGEVFGVSHDGSVIGGRFDGIYGNECCGPLGGAFFDGSEISHVSGFDLSVTTGVSGDGRYAVGVREPANAVAFRYDPIDGPYILVPGHYLFDTAGSSVIEGEPSDVSYDGRIIVGTGCIGGDIPCGGWRWDEGFGAEYISFDPLGISPDGLTIVGSSSSLGAVIWNEINGLYTIPGTLPGATAEAVSNNGIVVGTDSTGAFIWDINNGRRELASVLVAAGSDLGGLTLSEAIDISADGQTIVGRGLNSDGIPEGWVADLLILAGDLNLDGFVGITDLNIILNDWNQFVPPGDSRGDIAGVGGTIGSDGYIGIDDLNYVLGNWNAGTPPSGTQAIPEPSSVLLLAAGWVGLVGRRTCKQGSNI